MLGCDFKPVIGQLYEIKKSCGRVLGVALFQGSKYISELKYTEYYFKPLLWNMSINLPRVIFRINHRGCGSLAGLNFTEITMDAISNYSGLIPSSSVQKIL